MAASTDWEGVALANGRYLITAKLGEGGMGSVFRAMDRNIEADVVIKIPRPAMMEDPEFAARFTREIRSLVRLSHPHIVKVSDVGTWDGTPFAVMQFLPGGSLEDRRRIGPKGQPLPCDPKKVSGWLEAVAGALDYVHAQGYVHRDVKPGNILFDAEGHAFLSDFGVAKVLASSSDKVGSQTSMTGAGMVLGTPEYMAPELIMGEPFDGRVDQYALAVTVYELLCGRRPFEDETKTRVLVLHTTKAPPNLAEWAMGIPERLSKAVLRGLSKNPDERYANCAALATAVAAAAGGAATRDERIRLKCPGCGKSGGMPAADFEHLRQGGGRPSCPACKVPLEVVGPDKKPVAAGATNSGTTRFSAGSVEPYNLAQDPVPRGTRALLAEGGSGQQTSISNPTTTPSGTVALSARTSRGEQPTDPEPRGVIPSRASKTLVEPVPSPATLNAMAGAVRDTPNSGSVKADVPSPAHPIEPRTLVISGTCAACVLLISGLAFAWLRPGRTGSATDSTPIQEVGPAIATSSGPSSAASNAPASQARLSEPASAKTADIPGVAVSPQPPVASAVSASARHGCQPIGDQPAF